MISVIIPIYIANLELLDIVNRCLQSLGDYDLVTVDDASPIPFDAIIKHEVNTGFTKSVNDGIKKAKGDILVIANDDIVFVPGWEKALLDPLQDPTIGVCSLPTNDEELSGPKGLLDNQKFGSIWATRRDVIDKVGLLDETMPNYFQDTDMYKRVKNAGYRVVKNNTLVIPHIGKATYSKVDPNDDCYYQDMEVFRKKWGQVE